MSPRHQYCLPSFIATPGVIISDLPSELAATMAALLGFAFVNNYEWTDVPGPVLCRVLNISTDALRARLERLEDYGHRRYLRCKQRPGRPPLIYLLCRYDPVRQVVLTPSVGPSTGDDGAAPDVDGGGLNADDPPRGHYPPRGHGDHCTQDVVVNQSISPNGKQQQHLLKDPPTPRVDAGQEAAVKSLLSVGVEPRSTCEDLVREHGAARCQGWAAWGESRRGRCTNLGGLVRRNLSSGAEPAALSAGKYDHLIMH
jgi:hypothetical protein